MNPILIYHANCPDGFGARYAFWCKFGNNMDYYPMGHQQELEFDPAGRDIYMADIAFGLEKTLDIKSKAKSLVILDHHITAFHELEGLSDYYYSDKNSGSVIAWKYLFKTEPPLILQYVEDRDIYKFELEYSKEILAALDSYPFDVEVWDSFNDSLKVELNIGDGAIIDSGKAILRYEEETIQKVLKYSYFTEILGYNVPVVNATYLQSDAINILAKGHPFAAGYYFNGSEYKFSLRSSEDGIDVSKIAEHFGGGGHKHAAGFRVEFLNLLKGVS